ncbi:MAG: hypothetical protein F4Y03_01515 [Alphaproteobacteria bacterium]|nr:hypothetical protein [Alphaproteobacteria bacterium]
MRAHDELFDDRPCGKSPSETRLETLRSLLELALDTARNNSPDENHQILDTFILPADLTRAAGPAEEPRRNGSPAQS